LTDRNQSPFETGTDSKDDPMASAGPTSNSFISQRLKLHYVDWGNRGAPPLLLVHGGRDHCRNWDWVAEKLRDRYHIIAPDLRGHGDSAWSPDGNYDMDGFVYDLAQLIHQLDLGPLSIVAHSMGGNIALRYTGLYPDNVRKLVAIEGLGPSPKVIAERAKTSYAERFRKWIDDKRQAAGRTPRRYATLEDALARMMGENAYLTEAQARHLTIHGISRNEDGTWSWKFDNYLNVWPAFDMRQDDIAMGRDRLPHPAPLWREQLGLESREGRPARAFQHSKGHRVRKCRPLAAPRSVRPVHVHARRIPLSRTSVARRGAR
jgi:pimeloyl-ACP methyl ester carboxylesterase